MRIVGIGSFLLLSALGTSVAQTDDAVVADQVWKEEEAYWRYVKAGAVEDYLALWHADFTGWPCITPAPARKNTIGDWVRDIRDNGWGFSYELKREAVQVFGEVAIVFYTATSNYDFGDSPPSWAGPRWIQPTTWKYTHTWQRDGDSWLIIGGMCGTLE
jgi:hypothetical protein